MSTTRRSQLAEVMNLAWQFIKRNGYNLSEALKVAWANIKLRTKMKQGIVKFYFKKVDGSLREAYGTLKESMLPVTKEERKTNVTCQTYYDTEKQSWRCFKKANLVNM